MKHLAVPVLCLALSACFTPNASDSSNNGSSDTDGEVTLGVETLGSSGMTSAETLTQPRTTSETADDTETSAEETETSTDETSSMDAPPVIESFTVDGSTMPSEVEVGGFVLLEVVATDDMAIAQVEFFDGNEPIGLVAEEPYELEVLLTSADSGIHRYRAVVTDSGEQQDHSETVMLSVNIAGGEVAFLREHLFVGADVFGVSNAGISYAPPNRVYLGARTEDVSGYIMAYNSELSLIWEHAVPEDVDNAPVQRGDEVISPRGNRADFRFDYHRIDPASGATLEVAQFESGTSNDADFLVNSSYVLPTDDGYILRSSMTEVGLFDEALLQPTSALGGSEIPNSISRSSLGGFLGVINGSCPGEHPSCMRKYRENGSVEWTVGIDALERVAPNSTGGAFGVSSPETDGEPFGYIITEINGEATTTQSVYEYPAENTRVFEAIADRQGGLILAGFVDGYPEGRAFVARYDSDLNEIWRQDDIISGADSVALALAVSESSVYVYGLEDLDALFLAYRGDAWIASLSL